MCDEGHSLEDIEDILKDGDEPLERLAKDQVQPKRFGRKVRVESG
jgi:hypothetical protein